MAITNRKDRSVRSQQYQAIYNEIPISVDIMETFQNEDSLLKRLNPFEYNEDIFDLEEELKVEFWRLVDDSLSERQAQILKELASGKTQMEVAKIMNVNQSSIVKSVKGSGKTNANKQSDSKSNNGGSRAKLRALIDKDPKIQSILARIAAIRDESWI